MCGQVGEWSYSIVNPSATNCNVRVTIEGSSTLQTAADQPVEITVQTSKSILQLDPSKLILDIIET